MNEARSQTTAGVRMTADNEFGAVLIDVESAPYPIFRPVESFTREEHDWYKDAHEVLRDYLSKSMILFVTNESSNLLDYLITIGSAMKRDRRIIDTDENGVDIRDAAAARTLALTNAYFVYREQRREQAKHLGEARGDDTFDRVQSSLRQLYKDCFGYRWLVESRNALVHMDLRAVELSVGVRNGDNDGTEIDYTLTIARDIVLQTANLKKPHMADYRTELESLTGNLVVIELLEQALPAVVGADKEIRDAMYPQSIIQKNAEIVRGLIRRFSGRRGVYCMQTGPGFTRETKIPPHIRLDPNVLSFADSLA